MRHVAISLLSLLVGAAVAATPAPSFAEDSKDEGKLVGTWTLVSKRNRAGDEIPRPQGITLIKIVTPTHFAVIAHEEDGEVVRTLGGTYTLKGETFREVPEFANSSNYDLDNLKGRAQTFRCVVDGNRWHHSGTLSNGGTIDEVWERVEKAR